MSLKCHQARAKVRASHVPLTYVWSTLELYTVTFAVAGPGQIIGIDNGRRDGAVDYKDLRHEAFMGRGLALMQSERTPGTLTIKATSPSLEPATITLSVH